MPETQTVVDNTSSSTLATSLIDLGIRTAQQLHDRATELGGVEYLIEGLLPQQSLSLFVGDSGVGKSPLLYQMAICVAAGVPFLGRRVEQGRVLYMDCEDGVAQVDEMVSRISNHLGLSTLPKDLLLWNLNDSNGEHKLEALIMAAQPKLVILDPLNALYTGVERDNPTASAAFREIRGLMQPYECSVCGVHHLRKPDAHNSEESLEDADLREWFYQARGPRVLINGCDVRIGLDKSTSGIADTEVVMKCWERLRGELPAMWLARVFGPDDEPVAYRRLMGEELLRNEEQIAAFRKLPPTFRFKDAKQVYGRSDQPTSNFLRKCEGAEIVRNVKGEGYKKIIPPAPPTEDPVTAAA